MELWHHSSEQFLIEPGKNLLNMCLRENLAKDNIVCGESRIWCIMYSTWILQRRMNREALTVSSSTFNNTLLFWFTICKYRMCRITERLFKSVLDNQLHSMLSKFWNQILWKNPPLILGNGVIHHVLYLCVLWIGGYRRSFLQKQWMNMINVAWLEWTVLHFFRALFWG